MDITWIFDGIGTEIIILIVGGFVGGFAGYKIGVNHTLKQQQKAGDNSTQTQIGTLINKNGDK